jgi:hypothetical protein
LLGGGIVDAAPSGPGRLGFPFFGLCNGALFILPELAAFLAGTSPATAAALVFISLLALWALAWRLLALNEDMF